MLAKIGAVWTDNSEEENAITYLKILEINLDLISEKYTSEAGEKIIVMASGNCYIVKNFNFLESSQNI